MTPLEFLYYLGYSIKKRYALRNQKSLSRKVICLGNITLGGTGKTPATIALAEEAKKRGFKPCILTRGYKGRAKGPCFVSRGEGPLLDEYQAGDEALLMAEKLKGIPIVKGKDRYEAGMFAIQNLKSQIPDLGSILFILDDGFQHWGLARDRDILLIDSINPFGNRRLLPLGSLREPIGAINRADIIVITKTDKTRNQSPSATRRGDKSEAPPTHPSPSRGEGDGEGDRSQQSIINSLIDEIRQYNTKAQIFSAEHKPSKFIAAFRNRGAINRDIMPSKWSEGKSFFGFCGIGNPISFKETLLSVDIELKGFKTFRDHYRYNQDDIQLITKDAEKCGAEWIVTTEKDIMRLKGLSLPDNLVSLAIEFSVDDGFYEEVFKYL